ncbi:hypothetical protein NL676_012808 [Syzygium grande]|nr:hypothetical protein NL676_012808 [Syzygium grande]
MTTPPPSRTSLLTLPDSHGLVTLVGRLRLLPGKRIGNSMKHWAAPKRVLVEGRRPRRGLSAAGPIP